MKKIVAVIFALVVVTSPIFYWFMTNPSNSLELMQTLRNSKNPESLFLDFKNIDYESIEYIQEEFDPNTVKQITLLEFDEKTYFIQTTPGTKKMKIINIVSFLWSMFFVLFILFLFVKSSKTSFSNCRSKV